MWIELKLPQICRRVLGFSVPVAGDVWIMSNEGLHLLYLDELTFTTDSAMAENYEVYDTSDNVLRYKGREYPMLGEGGGNPILESQSGEKLKRGPRGKVSPLGESWESYEVLNPDGSFQQKLPFCDMCDEWQEATFSMTGRYVLIGVPNGLTVYRFNPRIKLPKESLASQVSNKMTAETTTNSTIAKALSEMRKK